MHPRGCPAVGTAVPTHFVPGSSTCRERTAPIPRLSLHDLLSGWLLSFLDLCSLSVHDCLRVDTSCVSRLEPGSAAAFPWAGSGRLCCLCWGHVVWGSSRQLNRFHFSSLSSALASSSESLCAQYLFPSCIQPTSCCLATPGRPRKNIWKVEKVADNAGDKCV